MPTRSRLAVVVALLAVTVAGAAALLQMREDTTCVRGIQHGRYSTTRLVPCETRPDLALPFAIAALAGGICTAAVVLARRDTAAFVIGGITLTSALTIGLATLFQRLWAPPPTTSVGPTALTLAEAARVF